jgi:predicted nuclease of predicted toxin-antitoxin system
MKVLLDECLPKRLKRELRGHDISTVQEMGWAGVKNGALLSLIQDAGFEVFLTIDGSLKYQQNLRGINFAITLLRALDNTFDTLRMLMPEVMDAMKTIKAGEFVHINE